MIKLGYVKENRDYQRLLDQVYRGKIVPINRFINADKAILLHYCFGCSQEFYARPSWLLTKESQKHDCSSQRYESIAHSQTIQKATPPRKKMPKELSHEILQLHKQGLKQVEIADRLRINRKTVSKHLKKAMQG